MGENIVATTSSGRRGWPVVKVPAEGGAVGGAENRPTEIEIETEMECVCGEREWTRKVGSLSIQPEIEPWRNAVVSIVLGVSTSFQNMLKHLKRGVNKKERVANDVETEKIIFEDVPEGFPMQISSVVQNRGSIPLFWLQETSRLNLKPDIILSKRDQHYGVTRLHFENLVERYGKPVVVLNLIKAATFALTLIGFLYCQVTPDLQSEGFPKCPCFE
ncbi:putative phosphoinositide phosphatase SAC3 [Forsythia ovata]|uniref:Phosphoinositide phosphatase SAC3 n=1 Tax=Forsythia ovata TaxID=205694 RepID=A0ABD1S8H1_9LAMI